MQCGDDDNNNVNDEITQTIIIFKLPYREQIRKQQMAICDSYKLMHFTFSVILW